MKSDVFVYDLPPMGQDKQASDRSGLASSSRGMGCSQQLECQDERPLRDAKKVGFLRSNRSAMATKGPGSVVQESQERGGVRLTMGVPSLPQQEACNASVPWTTCTLSGARTTQRDLHGGWSVDVNCKTT